MRPPEDGGGQQTVGVVRRVRLCRRECVEGPHSGGRASRDGERGETCEGVEKDPRSFEPDLDETMSGHEADCRLVQRSDDFGEQEGEPIAVGEPAQETRRSVEREVSLEGRRVERAAFHRELVARGEDRADLHDGSMEEGASRRGSGSSANADSMQVRRALKAPRPCSIGPRTKDRGAEGARVFSEPFRGGRSVPEHVASMAPDEGQGGVQALVREAEGAGALSEREGIEGRRMPDPQRSDDLLDG